MSTAAALYVPPDADVAWEAWSANCGPAAFAAVLGRPVMACRRFFPRFPAKPWTNPTHMLAALALAGVRHRASTEPVRRGLAFVQWEGPWTAPGANVLWAYRFTHWLGVAGGRVYDVNADGWLTREEWEARMVPLFQEHDPRVAGWFVRTRIEVLG